MTTAELLDELQYRQSPNFFEASDSSSFDDAADFAHTFRRASDELNLRGVYALRQSVTGTRDSIIPVVYVCEVAKESEASHIHRKVWNQNVVPFLIVSAPETVRLYSGFRFSESGAADADRGLLHVAKDMSTALTALSAFHSERIDDGTIWEKWGESVTPETRVDWKLLSHLNVLDEWLRTNGLDEPGVSHSLIGKYVYLRYLRDRDILSDSRLAKWGLSPGDLFSRNATLKAFWRVVDELDNWLNGSMFPLSSKGDNRPRQEHLRKVASTFAGDDPLSGQLSLDFEAYDFSFIPIETLSVIYEQFLHAPTKDGSATKGKKQGAYYTPIPIVNFMLEELDNLHPFKDGMKVMDPACGSGAFLVQCYRRIIEQDAEFEPGKPMRPARLKELLQQHVFGIDRDEEACRVAELSLSLTLLDYVDPPDLMRYTTFQLPSLHNENIFHGDFFDSAAAWRSTLDEIKFDWIVGNPPWVELKSGSIRDEDRPAWSWLQSKENETVRPTGGNQVAEAFVWEALDWCDKTGKIAFLLPAMTLFKSESKSFRARLVSQHQIDCVANFANFSDVLFPGHRYRDGKHFATKRPTRPAVALVYGNCEDTDEDRLIPVFSPFVADQSASRSQRPNRQKDAWNMAIDGSRIAYLHSQQLSGGDSLPWKAAMWGTHHDVRLLHRLERIFEGQTLGNLCDSSGLQLSQGIELRNCNSGEPVEPLPEIAGELKLDMSKLKNCGRIFSFPTTSVSRITNDEAFVRRGRVRLPLAISKPPHVIVDKARRFAVYEDRFVAVPPRQIGVSGSEGKETLLKAIALLSVSDFAVYHQFFTTPEWGVSTSISTLDAYKRMPAPLEAFDNSKLAQWAKLHSEIVKAERALRDTVELDGKMQSEFNELIQILNEYVYDLLKIADHERCLVTDLVNIKMQLTRGKVTADVIRSPKPDEILAYSSMLRDELDAFVDDQPKLKHQIVVSKNDRSAIVAIRLLTDQPQRQEPRIQDVDDDTAAEFAKIRELARRQHSQWFYFNRNLRMYQENTTYVFKPLSRLHWTQSQAKQDASTIIAETLS